MCKCWLAYRKAKPKTAAGYCKKGDDTQKPYEQYFPRKAEDFNHLHSWNGWEWGEISQQGQRTDLNEISEEILGEKRPIRDVAMDHGAYYIRFHKGMHALRALVLTPRKLIEPPEVIVLWGPTQTGKTYRAFNKYWNDIPHYVWKPSNEKYFDGYDGEDKIILEEFRGELPWGDLLSLLQEYECRAPVKYGFVQIQASKFIITSPSPPCEWYRHKHNDKYDKFSQLQRRITKVICTDPANVMSHFG
jgi:hypothetical protein